MCRERKIRITKAKEKQFVYPGVVSKTLIFAWNLSVPTLVKVRLGNMVSVFCTFIISLHFTAAGDDRIRRPYIPGRLHRARRVRSRHQSHKSSAVKTTPRDDVSVDDSVKVRSQLTNWTELTWTSRPSYTTRLLVSVTTARRIDWLLRN